MQDTITKSASAAVELADARLFREACYVDGQWIQASSGQTINVDNPATRETTTRQIIGAGHLCRFNLETLSPIKPFLNP